MSATALAPEVPILVLDPTEHAPSLARHFLVDCFRDLGVADDYTGRVVVTELVTNAYKHVGTGQIVVRIFEDERDGLVVVEVWDEGDGMPVVKGEDFDAIGGRGLLLMTQLVHDWGTRPTNEGGKIVWTKFAR
ncbi:ATP-binding protein [Actinomadura sp. BRA 177]|uniref:ATP-binding protein n=1 Tax=Actinomadura sp. BRA 177 TaxID=2745202 RepID=UPI001594FA42|nr:ATP-binding protein [Actinomadura sp. BRA 177]NVI90459.1 ATP-binding protein [Actinomadura sp. BRA 177]